jgi:hypothetical protein
MTIRIANLIGRRKREMPGHEVARFAQLADGSLAPERRAALEARVAASPELRKQLDEQLRAVQLVRSAAMEVEAPAALRDRVEAQRRVRRGQPRRIVFVAAAGATALAVAAGLILLRSGATGERLHADLAATALAPGARGTATLTQTASGWRIELDAAGLPRLANGRFYEAWLRELDGVLVPIGTFNQGREVTLWAGVSPTDFATLTVTRETSDGEQASSGAKVLVGQVEARG